MILCSKSSFSFSFGVKIKLLTRIVGPCMTLPSLLLPPSTPSDLTSYFHPTGSSSWSQKMPTMSCLKVSVLPGVFALNISIDCYLPSFKTLLKYYLIKKTSLTTLSDFHSEELHILLILGEHIICHSKQDTFESENEPQSNRKLEQVGKLGHVI